MEKYEWNTSNCFQRAINLKDILHLSDEELFDNIGFLYANYETVVNNFDYFLRVARIMSICGLNVINVDSFETVLFINEHLREKTNFIFNILDDFENKSRLYIKPAQIDKCLFSIPLAYLMWGKFDDMLTTTVNFGNNGLSYNGNQYVLKDTLMKVKELISYLKSLGKYNDLEIILLVSSYINGHVSYDDSLNYSFIEDILSNHKGLCIGIANLTTLLLNNPEFKIDVRTIANSEHALNIVRYKDKYYFLDNTWMITRGKASGFNDKYFLYGKKEFDYYIDREYLCDNPHIELASSHGIRKEEINKCLAKNSVFRRV